VERFTPATSPAYLHVRTATVDALKAAQTPEGGFPRMVSVGKDAIRRMPPNTPMLSGLLDIQGSDSLEIGAYRYLLNDTFSDALGFPQPDPTHPIINLLAARHLHSGVPLDLSTQAPGAPRLKLLSGDEGYLYENETALARAFIPRTVHFTDAATARAAVLDRAFRPLQASFVTAAGPTSGGVQQAPVPVRVTRQEPNVVELQGAFRPGQWVFLTDTWFPGWTAWQGASRLELLPGNFTFRAAKTCADGEPVRFLYLPGSFQVGAFLALLAAASMAALAAFACVRRGAGA
jgi:hypothetical protein